jgi:Mrp family chromosome partitioning ATPase/predicted Fe-Mo cluster-binding NifX family protein
MREAKMTDDNKCPSCDDSGCKTTRKRPGKQDAKHLEYQELVSRMSQIKHKVMVLSGKGGVGKSTVAVNLAVSLAVAGNRVGLLDVDIHGPSIPKLLHIEGAQISGSGNGIYPVKVGFRTGILSVMSIGFMLPKRDDPVIWRGPMKYGMIKQFLKDVEWGMLDYLIIDSPPGTGDEPLSVAQLVEDADGAVIVTTPQELAIQDVRRCIVFCQQLNLPVLGVIENMSGFICPECGKNISIFGSGGGESMAKEMRVPYLGEIPISVEVVTSGDRGKPLVQTQPHSETTKAFGRIVQKLLKPEPEGMEKTLPSVKKGQAMKIAIPTADGLLCPHFGHCQQFAVLDVDSETRTINRTEMLTPPPHEPGILPAWLNQMGCNVIITGGMGARAQSLFTQNNITVVVGAPSDLPEKIVKAYLDGSLKTGTNICDH